MLLPRGYQPPPEPGSGCCCGWFCVSALVCAVLGRWPSLTLSVFSLPLRATLSWTVSPGLCSSTTEESAEALETALPSIDLITSPCFRPACSAGLPAVTCATCAPLLLSSDWTPR